ncbi:MAG: hypothetical protein JWQ11_3444, partial [Rhizobacter sp.]|nr:hypothetical protein [Rhizobacter sp.]
MGRSGPCVGVVESGMSAQAGIELEHAQAFENAQARRFEAFVHARTGARQVDGEQVSDAAALQHGD